MYLKISVKTLLTFLDVKGGGLSTAILIPRSPNTKLTNFLNVIPSISNLNHCHKLYSTKAITNNSVLATISVEFVLILIISVIPISRLHNVLESVAFLLKVFPGLLVLRNKNNITNFLALKLFHDFCTIETFVK